jgi:uncharacterized protein (DUF58 family)
MRIPVLPGPTALVAPAVAAAAVLAALLSGIHVSIATRATLAVVLVLAGAATVDLVQTRRTWRRSRPAFTRRLPAAFAIGVRRTIHLSLDAEDSVTWRLDLYDGADARLVTVGLPARLTVSGGTRTEATYTAEPTERGDVAFEPAALRVRSRWGFWDLRESLGEREVRRVYPDFAQVARYAWLAGDRRLQEIGIKTRRRRGEGTDFKQLSEYRVGDSVRHIDWRATLRLGKPIVREFQDERDQRVLLLIDCGRRLRADDRQGAVGTTHFDQVLNAIMLLSYVALRQGDAVGAMTFGTPPGDERSIEPRKGTMALNVLMGELYDVQPTPTHSDYVAAAQALLRRERKRALVIILTNFRDESSTELGHALRLLRSRHLVLLASLRERAIDELMSQALASGEAAVEVAAAHLYEQSRRDAFNLLAARDALMVDAEPDRLGIELVNRYHAIKRAGLI